MPFMGIKMCTKMHKKRNLLPISEICNTSILYLYFISLAAYKRAFISLHISTVGVIRLYFKCIVKFDQTTFYFWTISNTMQHKLCSSCKRYLLFQRQQELWLALLKIYCNLTRCPPAASTLIVKF